MYLSRVTFIAIFALKDKPTTAMVWTDDRIVLVDGSESG